MLPWEVFEIGLSKMLFPAFPGLELVNREGLLKAFKSSQKRKYLIWQYYNNIIGLQLLQFLVNSKTNSNHKEFMNPG